MATRDREVILATDSRGERKLTSPDICSALDYLMPAHPITYTQAIIPNYGNKEIGCACETLLMLSCSVNLAFRFTNS